MDYIATQQLEALLYTAGGVPTTRRIRSPPVKEPSPPRVDMKEFKTFASWLGFLLGVLTVAADIGGHVFLLRDPHMATKSSFVTFTIVLSSALTVLNFSVFCLIRQVIQMVNSSEEVMEAFEHNVLLWCIIGVTGSYTIFDVFFLPAPKSILSVGTPMVATIVGYSATLKCLQMWIRRGKSRECVSNLEHDGTAGETRLMIV